MHNLLQPTETLRLFEALKHADPHEAILVLEDFLLRRQSDIPPHEQQAIWHGMLELHRTSLHRSHA